MNAIEDNRFTDDWHSLTANIGRPNAIVVISAHWQTPTPMITSAPAPTTIHDYGGGSPALQSISYRCPGAVDLAKQIIQRHPEITPDPHRGLDHGSWSLLNHLYPDADIPTLQLSLATNYTPQQHLELAEQLRWLRDNSVLVIGSGNIVHNISFWIAWSQGRITDTTWAQQFDRAIFSAVLTRDFDTLANYQNIPGAKLAVPTDEHYLPLLYATGITNHCDPVTTSNFAHAGFESDCSRSIRFG